MARLVLSLDGQVMAEYNMNKERYTIGRLPDNDIRIDNSAVSGHHSLIINILNDSFLEDLNSTNGTYVNGKLIKKHALQHGDVVTVGHHQMRFVEDDRVARRQELRQSLVAQHHVGKEQVMIDDDDVGLERRLACLQHEAIGVECALRAEAVGSFVSAFDRNRIVVSVNHQSREPESSEGGPDVVVAKAFPDLALGPLRDAERSEFSDPRRIVEISGNGELEQATLIGDKVSLP